MSSGTTINYVDTQTCVNISRYGNILGAMFLQDQATACLVLGRKNSVVAYYHATYGGGMVTVNTTKSVDIRVFYFQPSDALTSSKTANYVYAAPNGSAGSPSFRKLVAADIPGLAASKITSGTLPVARGGTGQTSVDTTPTSGSSKMVTSGCVYTAVNDLKTSITMLEASTSIEFLNLKSSTTKTIIYK